VPKVFAERSSSFVRMSSSSNRGNPPPTITGCSVLTGIVRLILGTKADVARIEGKDPPRRRSRLSWGDGSRHGGELNDLAFELAQKVSRFRGNLPRRMRIPVAGPSRTHTFHPGPRSTIGRR
jgi:hypothetical protein